MINTDTLTASQTAALAALAADQPAKWAHKMLYRTATDLGVAASTLKTLERAGLVRSKSDAITRWGDRTRAAYRLTLDGTIVLDRLAKGN